MTGAALVGSSCWSSNGCVGNVDRPLEFDVDVAVVGARGVRRLRVELEPVRPVDDDASRLRGILRDAARFAATL